jgi:hypothetical protein
LVIFLIIKECTVQGTKKNQCIREKTGAQDIVKEIKQYKKKWLQHVQRGTQIDCQNKHCDIDQKDEGT